MYGVMSRGHMPWWRGVARVGIRRRGVGPVRCGSTGRDRFAMDDFRFDYTDPGPWAASETKNVIHTKKIVAILAKTFHFEN